VAAAELDGERERAPALGGELPAPLEHGLAVGRGVARVDVAEVVAAQPLEQLLPRGEVVPVDEGVEPPRVDVHRTRFWSVVGAAGILRAT
jgi:hypothetical protein